MATLNAPVTTTKGYASEAYTSQGASSQELWDACHDAAGDSTGTAIRAGWTEGESWNLVLYRGYMQFDTSSIGTGIITSATLKVTGTHYTRNRSLAYQVGSASSSGYADLKTTTDYLTIPAQGSASGTNSTAFTDLEISLNTAGEGGINASGNTLLSLRGTNDTTDVASISADSYDYMIITSAELIVVYTESDSAPTVTTDTVTGIDATIATLNGSITDTGGVNATTRGFYYVAGSGTPTASDTVVSETGTFTAESYSLDITGLTENTLYSVVAFATNTEGTSTGSVVEFTAEAGLSATTLSATSITQTSATLNGIITNLG